MIVRRFSVQYVNEHKKYFKPDWKPSTISVGPAYHNPIREIYRGLRNGGMSQMEARNHLYTVLFHAMTYTPSIDGPAYDNPQYA